MSTLSLRLPDSLHRAIRKLAEKDGISINQFIASAVGEKLAALMTQDYLTARAARGNRRAYEDVLSRALDEEPEPGDRVAETPRKVAKRGAKRRAAVNKKSGARSSPSKERGRR